jgi:hypothetical protein
MPDCNPDEARRNVINNRRITEATTCPECEGELGFDVDTCPACQAPIVWIQMKVALFSGRDTLPGTTDTADAERDAAIAYATAHGSGAEFATKAAEAGFEFTGRGACTKCELVLPYMEPGSGNFAAACRAMRKALGIVNSLCGPLGIYWVKRAQSASVAPPPPVQPPAAEPDAEAPDDEETEAQLIEDAEDEGCDRVFAEKAVRAGFKLTGNGLCHDCQLMNAYRGGHAALTGACNAMRKHLGIPEDASCCDTDHIWVARKKA